MKRILNTFGCIALIGCAVAKSPDVFRYNDGTVDYAESTSATRPARLEGVTEIRLDREYVTVIARDGLHIIPRARFIKSSPGVATTVPAAQP